jgi:hypothetical protein
MVIWSFYWFIDLIFKLLSNLKIMKNRRHCHFNIQRAVLFQLYPNENKYNNIYKKNYIEMRERLCQLGQRLLTTTDKYRELGKDNKNSLL